MGHTNETTAYRFGTSMPRDLVDEFDKFVEAHGYASRSEAIRDLIRERLVEGQWGDGEGDTVATLTLIYDCEGKGVAERLGSLRRAARNCIVSSTQASLREHLCVEAMLLRGDAANLQEWAGRALSIRGVLHGKLVPASLSALAAMCGWGAKGRAGSDNPRRAYFDEQAANWDADRERIGEERQRLAAILPTLPIFPGMTVLDAGCGTGRTCQYLLDRVSRSGQVIGVDFSEKMLDAARRRLGDRVALRCEDITRMAIADGAVDVVFCYNAFPHVPDQLAALQEFARVLKPGGAVIILHLAGSFEVNRRHRDVGGVVAEDQLPPRAEMERLCMAAGLTAEKLEDRPDLYLLSARRSSNRRPVGRGAGATELSGSGYRSGRVPETANPGMLPWASRGFGVGGEGI